MHPRYELVGQVFGRLTVIAFDRMGPDYASLWRCRCECGNEKVVIGKNLVKGRTKSCGCQQNAPGRTWKRRPGIPLSGAVYRSHGMADTPPYNTWMSMRQRCNNPNNQDYRNYGGRGIRVCDEWNASFEAFWRDMAEGWAPGLSIERVDPNLGYSKENCIWIPLSDQWKTRRSHGAKRADGTPAKPYKRRKAARDGIPPG